MNYLIFDLLEWESGVILCICEEWILCDYTNSLYSLYTYIPNNLQKHPQLHLEDSSKPQNKMEKENWSVFKGRRSTLSVYLLLIRFCMQWDIGNKEG